MAEHQLSTTKALLEKAGGSHCQKLRMLINFHYYLEYIYYREGRIIYHQLLGTIYGILFTNIYHME